MSNNLAALVRGLSHRHSSWQIWSDFVETAAISISNAVDIGQREKREAEYMRIVKKYQPEEIAKFPEMLGALVLALEDGISDVLGKTYHDLELHNKWAGQYFTPFEVCLMMAKMTLSDASADPPPLPECGFITVMEPAAGSGAMVLAFAVSMKEAKLNYQTQLHVTAVDVDLKCVAMCYLQLSLLHIPAVIVHGSSLSLEEWSRWYTPAHILNGWDFKLRRRAEQRSTEPQPEPVAADVTFDDRGQGMLFGDAA